MSASGEEPDIDLGERVGGLFQARKFPIRAWNDMRSFRIPTHAPHLLPVGDTAPLGHLATNFLKVFLTDKVLSHLKQLLLLKNNVGAL